MAKRFYFFGEISGMRHQGIQAAPTPQGSGQFFCDIETHMASRFDELESMKQKVNGTHNIVVQLSETAYGVL